MERPPPPMQPDDRQSDGRAGLAAAVGERVAVGLIVLVLGLILVPVRSQPPPPRVLSIGPSITITYSESELWIAVAVAAALMAVCLPLLVGHVVGRIRASRERAPRDV